MKPKFWGFLLLLLSISAFGQTDLEKCQQRSCYGFGPPSGPSQNGHIFQDLTKTPPDLYCAVGGGWQKCGSGTGNASVLSAPQFRLFVQPNPGSQSVAGPATTALDAVAPSLNSVKNAALFCTVLGTLDGSCFSNALAANTTISVPPGTYTIPTTVNITQSNVLIQCLKGTTFVQSTANSAFNITGNNVTFDGCSISTTGQTNPAIQVGAVGAGVTNFTYKNGGMTNSSSNGYVIRVDSSTGINFTGNTCATPSNTCAVTYASANVTINSNQGAGQFSVLSPATGGAGNSVVFSNNSLSPMVTTSGGGTILTLGDFSGSTNPIDSITVANNNCKLTGTDATHHAFGCFSIVNKVSKCAITGNTMNGDGQYVDYALLELGSEGCTVTGNVINGNDTHSQNFYDIATYGGYNIFANNYLKGWGATADGIRLYAQTAAGTANPSDNNLFIGNTITGTAANGASSKGLHLICNVAGSTFYNSKIIGNKITSASTLQWGMGIENALGATCPGSTTISENEVKNTTYGVVVMNVDNTIGRNDITGAATAPIFYGGTGTASRNTIANGVVTPDIIPTNLSPSVQGLCYPTANQPITNAGCAAVNAGQVSFTPTAVGWYRIIAGGAIGVDRGDVEFYSYYSGANFPALKVTFSVNSFGGESAVKVTPGRYGGDYGAIDQIRASTDGGANLYLDIHIKTVAGVQPITMIFYGQAIFHTDIVASPVVGAVVGSSSVALLDMTLFNTNPAYASVSTAETGQHYAAAFNATGSGFQYHGTAPSGHCLIGDGNNYVDATNCMNGTGTTNHLLQWLTPTTAGDSPVVVAAGANYIQPGLNVFSALPACNSTTEGAMAPVTDSTVNTWGTIVAGGGTNHILAYCGGAGNWKVVGIQ